MSRRRAISPASPAAACFGASFSASRTRAPTWPALRPRRWKTATRSSSTAARYGRADAHRADWGLILVRTDRDAPKHKGISTFLLDMRLPGSLSRRLKRCCGTGGPSARTTSAKSYSKTCAYPATASWARRTGDGIRPSRGWSRSARSRGYGIAAPLPRRVACARQSVARVVRPLRKLGLEKRIAQIAIDLQVMRSMGYAIVGKQMAGLPVSRDASLASST